MSLTNKEMKTLKEACDKLDDGRNCEGNNYVTALLLGTVLDFMMRPTTLGNAHKHFKEHREYSTIASNPDNTLSDLKRLLDKFEDTKEGNLKLANDIWGNNHWSRAKFLRKIAEIFEERKITNLTALKKWAKNADFDTDVKGQFKTEEHSMGLAIFKWLQIRCGVNTIKPDRCVLSFIGKTIGRPVSGEVAVDSLQKIAIETNRKASLLDWAIWDLEREKPGKKKK